MLPLSVYLLTFVLTFESDRWYRRAVFLPLAAAMLALCAFGLQDSIGSRRAQTALPIYVVGLFVLCMFLHGEMARLRPAPRYLTRFYLMLSLGGAIGGVSGRPGRAACAAGLLRAGHRPGAVRAGRRRGAGAGALGMAASLALAACCALVPGAAGAATTHGARAHGRATSTAR